jgi:hypothetical protein
MLMDVVMLPDIGLLDHSHMIVLVIGHNYLNLDLVVHVHGQIVEILVVMKDGNENDIN